jgi:hypothetical protein
MWRAARRCAADARRGSDEGVHRARRPAAAAGTGGDRRAKKVTAIIKPFKLENVQDALRDLDIQGMT